MYRLPPQNDFFPSMVAFVYYQALSFSQGKIYKNIPFSNRAKILKIVMLTIMYISIKENHVPKLYELLNEISKKLPATLEESSTMRPPPSAPPET